MEHFHRNVISGANNGVTASIVRGMLRAVEPFYALAVSARNTFFDHGFFGSQRALRPVISVGNITTGGTGKTPTVRWLAKRLLEKGHHPAILTRGYKGGDEQKLLQAQLDGVNVEANPSRVEGARRVLESNPQIGVFILDDGFQHRQIVRDFDLVLIDASNPFGFNHVLPRGLLREPLTGMGRASAFLVTHIEAVEPNQLQSIESTLQRHNPIAPIFRCSHRTLIPPEMKGRKVMTFCGVGNPAAFEKQISEQANLVAAHRFDDHHNYSLTDLSHLTGLSRAAGAEVLVTTEKDWVKLQSMATHADRLPPVVRTQLEIRFEEGSESELLGMILAKIGT